MLVLSRTNQTLTDPGAGRRTRGRCSRRLLRRVDDRCQRASAGSSSGDSPVDADDGRAVDAAVSGLANTSETTEPTTIRTSTILEALVDVVKNHGRALISIYLVTEAVNFITNRAFHRLTNQIAMSSLAIPQQAIGNVWWLSQNPELLANGSAYQALTASVFLIAFPVSVLIKAVQSAYFYYVLCNDAQTGEDDRIEDVPRPENAFVAALAWAKSQFMHVRGLVPSLFTVEFLVSLVVIPLQFASLLVFSLPFTLPVIMSVHVALPVAIKRNIKGWKAVQASREMMKPILWTAAIPFVFVIIVQRMIDLGQGKIIASLPSRFYYELLEIPLGVLALGFGLSVVASVCRTSLPFVLFNMLSAQDRDSTVGHSRG